MDLPEGRRLTIQEYLKLEALSSERFEYRDGHAVALAVPPGNHGRIATNLLLALAPLVRARGCDVFAGDAKVVTPSGDHMIPDVVITCDGRDRAVLDARGEAVVRYPWLVAEILSPATAADDTTDKLDAYQSIAELTHYVVIDTRRRAIRLYERIEDGSLANRGRLQRLRLQNLGGLELTIEDVYRDTTVPALRDTSAPL